MDATALQSLVEKAIVEYDRATKDGNEAYRRSVALALHTELSKEPFGYSNFYRRLTYDTGAEALQYRILQPHLLNDSCPLDNGQHDKVRKFGGFRKIFKRKNKVVSTGPLGALPYHLLQIILEEYVDLATLTALRRVNRGFRAAIDKFSKYATIVKHAPQILRAVISVQAAPSVTCRELFMACNTKECANCRRFGGFLYLPTCSRVCFWCGMHAEACRPLSLENVRRFYTITKHELARNGVAIISPLPGHYRNSVPDRRNTNPLVDMTAASRVASKVYRVLGDPEGVSTRIQILKQENYNLSIASLANFPDEIRRALVHEPEFAFIQFFDDLEWGCSDRLKCLTPFPWIDTNNGHEPTLTSGVSCVGCKHKWVVFEPGHRHGSAREFRAIGARVDHSHRDYITHFLDCPHAIQWWRQNPGELPPIPAVQPVPGLFRFSMVPHKYVPEKSCCLRDAIRAIFKQKKLRFLASAGNKTKTRGRFVIPSGQVRAMGGQL